MSLGPSVYDPCMRQGLLSAVICLDGHCSISQKQPRNYIAAGRWLQIGSNNPITTLTTLTMCQKGFMKEKMILAGGCFWKAGHGSVALVLSGKSVESCCQSVKKAANFHLCLRCNILLH